MAPDGPCLTSRMRIVPCLTSHTMLQQRRPPAISRSSDIHLNSRDTTSIGSPRAVPVPWASSAHPRLLFPTASISRRCDDPFGAVKLALGPSCCTAVPRTPTASEITPDASRKAPHPSPRQYPSARRSNVWHRPRADSMPAAENATVIVCVSLPTPAAAACEHSMS